jgi:hypothetical protein
MGIKFIFNGYFRSGTTLIWEILKKSNPDKTVFYEPLHPHLFDEIAKNKHSKDDLHNKILWDEYLNLSNDDFKNLKNNHFKNNFLNDYKKINKYLNVYDNMSEDIILQTNRLHLYLGNISQDYNLNVIYIIRNPLDVYKSLLNIYNSNNGLKSKFIKLGSWVKNGYNPKANIYGAKDNIDLIYKKYGLPLCWGDSSKKASCLKNPFKIHVLNWTLSNYIGIKSLKKDIKSVLVYEKLTAFPFEIKKES